MAQFPFTREFARAVVEAHNAAIKVACMANTQILFGVSGMHVTIGGLSDQRRIELVVDEKLTDYVFGDPDAE